MELKESIQVIKPESCDTCHFHFYDGNQELTCTQIGSLSYGINGITVVIKTPEDAMKHRQLGCPFIKSED